MMSDYTSPCKHCDLPEAPADHFYWSRGKRGKCKIAQRKAQRRRDGQLDRTAYFADNYLERTYGITRQDYDAMSEAQGHRCFICNDDKHKLHVDHCHTTGVVRKLLCTRCNTALGLAREDTTILESMIRYISAPYGTRADLSTGK